MLIYSKWIWEDKNVNNNYKIVRTIFENVFQRVLECKYEDSGNIFYNNIITSKNLINLINIDKLRELSSNILDCYNTEDRIYIFTRPLKDEYKSFNEYVSSNLTLKQQFELTKKTIELSSQINNMTDVVQQKILDLDRLFIDNNNDIIVDCNLVFEQEYDISDNETFRRLGNIIHYIFSGMEIVDYNISDTIPPDILKIVVRCLTKEYLYPKDALSELMNSPIYDMIFKTEQNNLNSGDEFKGISKVVMNENKKSENIVEDTPDISENTSDISKDNVLDIYLRDTENHMEENKTATKNKFKISDLKKAAISIIIIIMVLFLGDSIMKKVDESKKTSGNIPDNNQTEQDTDEGQNTAEKDSDKVSDMEVSEEDSTYKFFNDDLLQKIGYTGSAAKIDKNIYVEGKYSLVIANDTNGNIKSLFAAINFKDENYSYMLKRQIGVSLKAKSEKDVEAQIVLEAYKDGILASNFHTTVNIYDDMWSQIVVPINVTDADSLNIYLEYDGQNKVWVDSVYIDVTK